jgi:hypothetical protein
VTDPASSSSGQAAIDPPRVTQQGRHTAVALAVTLGCLSYVIAHLMHAPHPHYLPVSGGWVVEPPAGAIAMGYYGVLLYGLGGAVGGLVLARLPGLATRLQTSSVSAGLSRLAALVVFGALAYFIVVELVLWH